MRNFAIQTPDSIEQWLAGTCVLAASAVDSVHYTARGAEHSVIKRARPARRQQFLAGRSSAAAAARALGLAHWPPIPANTDGSPAWPAGVVGSISHSDQLAVTALSVGGELTGLGIDCEPIGRVDASLYDSILTPAEMQTRTVDPTVHFSAKESLYKALNALKTDAASALEFQDIQVIIDDGRWRAVAASDRARNIPQIALVKGHVCRLQAPGCQPHWLTVAYWTDTAHRSTP